MTLTCLACGGTSGTQEACPECGGHTFRCTEAAYPRASPPPGDVAHVLASLARDHALPFPRTAVAAVAPAQPEPDVGEGVTVDEPGVYRVDLAGVFNARGREKD